MLSVRIVTLSLVPSLGLMVWLRRACGTLKGGLFCRCSCFTIPAAGGSILFLLVSSSFVAVPQDKEGHAFVDALVVPPLWACALSEGQLDKLGAGVVLFDDLAVWGSSMALTWMFARICRSFEYGGSGNCSP